LTDSVKVDIFEKVFKSLAPLIKLNEELLGVAPCLSACARAHMNLYAFPFLSVRLESFDEAEVFVEGPATHIFNLAVVVIGI
jgi:hypothetical protein